MLLVSFEVFRNAVVPCEALPVVDLSLWKDLQGGGPQIPSTSYDTGSDYYFKK